MTTKPPYPTELTSNLDGLYGVQGDVTEIVDSITYYLTPRKCSEQAPEFPCLLWEVKHKEWIHYKDKFCKFGGTRYETSDFLTHWLPLPPTPEES